MPSEDLRQAFALVEERAKPGDLLLLSPQSALSLRMVFRLPALDPIEFPELRRDLRRATVTEEPLRYSRAGVTYHFSHRTGLGPNVDTVWAAIAHLRSEFDLPLPPRVWLIRGPWEFSWGRYFRSEHPNLAFDLEVDHASRGIVFSIAIDQLRAARLHPRRPTK